MTFSEDTSRGYETFLESVGLTQQNMLDGLKKTVVTSYCLPSNKFCVDKSEIQGYGIYSVTSLNGTVGLFHTPLGFTVIGRYTNHDSNPNSIVIKDKYSDNYYLLSSVSGRTELTVDYNQVFEEMYGRIRSSR